MSQQNYGNSFWYIWQFFIISKGVILIEFTADGNNKKKGRNSVTEFRPGKSNIHDFIRSFVFHYEAPLQCSFLALELVMHGAV
jgi:hypothetical protein